jgi:hypothetical protein
MVHIDVTAMLSVDAFQRGLDKELAGLPSGPDVVLTPNHPAALALADLIVEKLGVPRVICDDNRIASLDGADRDFLDQAHHILLVDDVVITGDRLRSYRGSLERAGFVADHTSLALLVGLCRTSSLDDRQAIGEMTSYDGGFRAVEDLLLPDWDDDECPWCDEMRRLGTYGETGSVDQRLIERFELLDQTSAGLTDRLYLPWDGRDDMPLGEGSFFGDHDLTDAELFVSVAAALQALRNDEDGLTEYRATPVARVLNPTYWLRGRYYADSIVAAILRATRPHDLRASQIEPRLAKRMMSRALDPESVALRGEFFFSMVRGGLPLTTEAEALLGETLGEDEGVQNFLLSQLFD